MLALLSNRFNLVIEVLFISSKRTREICNPCLMMFQSRNRGSFYFKCIGLIQIKRVRERFNLGIEVLFISRTTHYRGVANQVPFQSRNRGSFYFKGTSDSGSGEIIVFQSRNRGSFYFKADVAEPSWRFFSVSIS